MQGLFCIPIEAHLVEMGHKHLSIHVCCPLPGSRHARPLVSLSVGGGTRRPSPTTAGGSCEGLDDGSLHMHLALMGMNARAQLRLV